MVHIDYDEQDDVLYAQRNGSRIVTSDEHDGLVMHFDSGGFVVGVQLHAASWITHPERMSVPDDIRAAIDLWVYR